MSKEYVKVTIQVADKTIMYEGPRDFVEAQIADSSILYQASIIKALKVI